MNRTIDRREPGASARNAWPIAASSNRPSSRWRNTSRPASMRINRNTESGCAPTLAATSSAVLGPCGELVGDAEFGGHVKRLGHPGALRRLEQCDVAGHHRPVTFCKCGACGVDDADDAGGRDFRGLLGHGAPPYRSLVALHYCPRQARAGLLDGDPVNFASSTVTIAVAPGNPKQVKSFQGLTKPGLTVVVCAPQLPCGSATQKVQESTGVDIKPRECRYVAVDLA